jgi:hypothetical protein
MWACLAQAQLQVCVRTTNAGHDEMSRILQPASENGVKYAGTYA